MSTEQNKAVVRRFYEQAFSTDGDLGVADELLSSDCIDHTAPPGSLPGVASFKLRAMGWRTAIPDLRLTIDDVLAEGDLVVIAWTGVGTHLGDLMGIPPTGKQSCMSGITFNRMSDGRIAERFGNSDELGLLQRLGVIPAGQ